MIGTVCIIMQKGLNLSAFNGDALFWGLISAASICVYTLEPIELLKKYSTSSIVGFGMFISGILACIVFRQVGIRSYLGRYDVARVICHHHTWYSSILLMPIWKG